MLYVYLLICVPFVLNYLFCSESNAQQSKNITSECIVKSVPDYRTGKELATLTTLWCYLAIALIKYVHISTSFPGDWARLQCCLQANNTACREACIQVRKFELIYNNV